MCSHYNKGIGEYGSCKYKTSCTNLHICQHFLQDDCKFGAGCKRTHRFDANAQKILNVRGVGPENMHRLCKLYKNKLLIASSAFKKNETGEWKKRATDSVCSQISAHYFALNKIAVDYCSICLVLLLHVSFHSAFYLNSSSTSSERTHQTQIQ